MVEVAPVYALAGLPGTRLKCVARSLGGLLLLGIVFHK